jgi:transposase
MEYLAMKTILAVDLGKFKSVFCKVEESSLKTEYQTVKTDPEIFHEIFADLDPENSIVLFEVGNEAGWVADMLRQMGLEFKVANVNHPAWKWKNTQGKSDKADASRLVLIYKQGHFPEVYIPEKEVREKRSLIYHRNKIVERLTQIKNSIRSLLCRAAVKLPAGKKCWTKKYLKTLEAMVHDEQHSELWRFQLQSELQQYHFTSDCLEKVTKRLDDLAIREKRVATLMTVPGVGIRTAEAIVAVIDDPHRFKNCREVARYIGFTPRRYQSGKMDRSGRISKQGNPYLRRLLTQASWTAIRFEWGREIFERVSAGSVKRRNTAVVAVARHILIRCWAMLRDNKPWKYTKCTYMKNMWNKKDSPAAMLN